MQPNRHSPIANRQRVLALDVGGHSVKSALVAPQGRMVGRQRTTPIDSTADAATILSTLVAVIEGQMDTIGEQERLIGVALGFPGPFDYEAGISRIRGVAKYESIYGLNVREALQHRLGAGELPILFRNDAEAAIVGEARYGASRSYQRLIGVTLGTGFGSAFLVDGVPVTTGEGVPPFGWLYPIQFERQPTDDVFSTRGLMDRLDAAGVVADSVAEAARRAREEDKKAQEVFATFGDALGTFLWRFVLAFEADAVLVLGGISHAYDLFDPPLAAALPVPVVPGKLGMDAALLGAAELFWTQEAETWL